MPKGKNAASLKTLPKDETPVSLKAVEKDGWKLKPEDPYTTILKLLRVVQDLARAMQEDKEADWDFDIKRDPLTGLIRGLRAKRVSFSSGSNDDEGEGGWKSLLYDGPKKVSN